MKVIGTLPIGENSRREGGIGCDDSGPLSQIVVVPSSFSLLTRSASLCNNISGTVGWEEASLPSL